jgi:DNA (cytosine-5)-methyltransferase 1
MRPPVLRLHAEELIVDNFAGGGGASTGIEWALGRSPDIAVNHDAQALALHEANHPATRHLCEDVFDVDPREACGGRPVALAWFSPDCTFFSKARGARPFRDRNKARRRRGLAGVVIRWADAVRPRVIAMENVEEFQDWGPLGEDGLPDPARRGFNFRRWWARLENLGYQVEMRELRACDYGAPTTRKRLFIIARCDGLPIVWPAPTHGPGLQPYRTAAECIDWSIPVRSIFDRKKPLAENTLRRIARALRRYVVEAAQPFVIPLTHHGERRGHPMDEPLPTITGAHRGELALVSPYLARIGQTSGNGKYVNDLRDPLTTATTKAEHLLVAPTMIQTGWGEREGQAPRALDLHKPVGTIMAGGNKHALVSAFLARHYGGHENDGAPLQMSLPTITARDHHSLVTSHLLHLRGTCADGKPVMEPMPTVTAGGNHLAEVRAFLVKYYGTDQDPQLGLPLHTITTKDRFGLVVVRIGGAEFVIADIGMRMLEPLELFNAQGFGKGYLRPVSVKGKPLTREAQVRLVGNSVCPPVAQALVRAQFVEPVRSAEVA